MIMLRWWGGAGAVVGGRRESSVCDLGLGAGVVVERILEGVRS